MKTHVLKITTTSQKLRYPPPFFLNGAGEGREGGKNRRKQIEWEPRSSQCVFTEGL